MFSLNIRAKDDAGGINGSFNSFIKDIDATNEELQKELKEAGSETALKMILYIQGNKVRPQNGEPSTLEKNINVEFFEGGWGVGDIEELNENAPYWAAINWGSDHMVGKRVPSGFFSPGLPNPTPDAFRQGRWNVNEIDSANIPGGDTGFPGTGGAHWSFIVSKPIPPMNYIEQTGIWLDTRLDEIKITT